MVEVLVCKDYQIMESILLTLHLSYAWFNFCERETKILCIISAMVWRRRGEKLSTLLFLLIINCKSETTIHYRSNSSDGYKREHDQWESKLSGGGEIVSARILSAMIWSKSLHVYTKALVTKSKSIVQIETNI